MNKQLTETPAEIVKAATDRFKETNQNVNVSNLRLEEIWQDGDKWHVVLSHPKEGSILDRYQKEIIV